MTVTIDDGEEPRGNNKPKSEYDQRALREIHAWKNPEIGCDASKGLAMAQLVKIAQDVAKKKTWKQLEGHAFVQVVQQLAKTLGIRLTKAKLAQVIPAAGAAVGGGFNSYFMAKVCNAAFYLYRERFLAEKYGADVIEVTVEPAQDVDPHYPEERERLP